MTTSFEYEISQYDQTLQKVTVQYIVDGIRFDLITYDVPLPADQVATEKQLDDLVQEKVQALRVESNKSFTALSGTLHSLDTLEPIERIEPTAI